MKGRGMSETQIQDARRDNEKPDTTSNSRLICLLAGYLVEWIDDEGDNDIFFKKEVWADCRAQEVRACGVKNVKVTPIYKRVAN